MRKLDFYWKSNKDWWYYDKNFIPRLKESAPPEAHESYQRYRATAKNSKVLPPHAGICISKDGELPTHREKGNKQIILY